MLMKSIDLHQPEWSKSKRCKSAHCKADEICQEVSGKPKCVPNKDEPLCWAVGDPHYRTFDGHHYDFQGTCTYTLSKTCGNVKGLPAFNIEAKNENRGNSKVSFVSYVTIQVYSFTISIMRQEHGFVRVDYQRRRLPIHLKSGQVQIYQSGRFVVIDTDFSLKVLYDWFSILKIYLASSYSGSVCGLCGNYNGNSADDQATPTGAKVSSVVDFGKSWSVDKGEKFCWHDCNGHCKPCHSKHIKKYSEDDHCGLMSKENGPFYECHQAVDPIIYVKNCEHDLCMNEKSKIILCQNLKNYADACQRKAISIAEWRKLAKCPLQCPENSKYTLCGNPCPKTCNDAALPNNCTQYCVESCECKDGYVLDGGKCIPKSSCGCVYEGRAYAQNETFWGDDNCSKKCVCNATTKKVECKPAGCKGNEKCTVVNQIQDCYSLSSGTCATFGNHHYKTFDGARYNFQGTCLYQFASLCTKKHDLEDFQINIQNRNSGHKAILMQIKVFNFTIEINSQNKDHIKVNGELTNLPFVVGLGMLSIYQHGFYVVLQTSFNLRVTFNWENHVIVTVPSSYSGSVCGLCGNFDGDKSNDFTTKGDDVAASPISFGKSWVVERYPECSDEAKGNCSESKLFELKKHHHSGNKECSVILDKKGPFRDCHKCVDPEDYFSDCVFDACSGHKEKTVCSVVTAYAIACQDAACNIYPWRSEKFCNPGCEKHSHFKACGHECPPTCPVSSPPLGCIPGCLRGCVCDDGYLLSGRKCVPLEECGCNRNGRYYKLGEIFFLGGKCGQECKCMENGVIECTDALCVSSASCSAAGDPHYKTFDGLTYDFQGFCRYTLAKTVTENSKLTPFAVSVRNEKWGNGCVSVTKSVSLEVYGYTLSLQYKREGVITINGIFSNLPLDLDNGKIQAYQHGLSSFIQTDFGLKVSYDLVYHVVVTVPGTYSGHLGGLCGNFNQNKNDEFQRPDKSLVPDASVFGESWKVSTPGFLAIHPDCGSPKQTCKCDESKSRLFKTEQYCGFLKKKGGPLSACYDIVNPESYFNNCVYDLCADSSIKANTLCYNIRTYVKDCQEAGIQIQDWRSSKFCLLSCPANSHYELCAKVCTATCPGIAMSIKCPSYCSEGCECESGYYNDGNRCVSKTKCGCFINGKYYQHSQKVISNDCKSICTCDEVHGYRCDPFTCGRNKQCHIENGTVSCSPIDQPCPMNSRFIACASACPATCENPAAPKHCNKQCAEGCQCNVGFVLHEKECIRASDCGCKYNGVFHKNDQEFWGDDQCRMHCKCDPNSKMVVCKETHCKLDEKCMVINNIRGCYLAGYSTCTAFGDPHYTTFDGRRFDFMGTCIYQLVGVNSSHSSLKPFTVNVQNNNRGNKAVSYTKTVTLNVYDQVLELNMDYPQRLLINGVVSSLPFKDQTNKVVAFISGGRGVIKTDFNVTVTYDWNSHATVTVPGTYANAVAGLCGNNNKNPKDDLIMNNGKVATHAIGFADSWKVGSVPGCTRECTGQCPKCSDAQKKQYHSEKFCGIITKFRGPFSQCFSIIDPKPYFDDCVFDTCQYKGHPSAFCTAIQLYVLACQLAGVQVQKWRSSSFCPSQCPINTHYELCGNSCPSTCRGTLPIDKCDFRCREMCACDDGFIQSGHKCVPDDQCGCVYKEKYYQKKEVFFPEERCNKKCQCLENGNVKCHDAQCGPVEECKVVNGIRGCHPKTYGTSLAIGGRHYTSFDGLRFDFQGTSNYTLAKVVKDDPSVANFSVVLENESYDNGKMAVTKTVVVYVYGYTIAFEKGRKWKVKVNGEYLYMPLTLLDGGISISQQGNNIILQVDFGLKVLYDTAFYLSLKVPSTYQGKIGGLGGDFDGVVANEFQLPNKNAVEDVIDFAAGWRANPVGSECIEGCEDQFPTCSETANNLYNAPTSCGMITDPQGPFKACHATINPEQYFKYCVFDACIAEGRTDVLCRSLQTYVAACQTAGVVISKWRTQLFCPYICPVGSRYKLCTSSCDRTCSVMTAPVRCQEQCFEGCECNSGYLFDGDRCVPVNKCGCVFRGRYLRVGQTFVNSDCSRRCTCQAGGMVCGTASCHRVERCEIKNGLQECYKNPGDCLVMPNKFASFDGLLLRPFQSGLYEVISLCDSTSDSWFRALADIKKCQKGGSLVARVHIFSRVSLVTISRFKKAWVNGRLTSLPVEVPGLLSASGNETWVEARIGQDLKIELGVNGDLILSAKEGMSGALCGACGNFDGNPTNDLQTPNRQPASSIAQFKTSWRAPDFSNCET
ncbi:IgGFc-binding protein-like [Spea bombifrons]|uniref:IgGFc-binding protein-like n=1 Tax=Spea bombifrons TaxID=233779 RepID=UPI00234B19A7|nr:IgGFc-binding protein-like [Spea bombifrons]